MTPDGEAVLRGHVLPARAAARDAELPGAPARGGGDLARAARRRRAAGRADRRRAAQRRPASAVDASRSRRRSCAQAVRGIARDLRAGVRRLRPRAEVPGRVDARVPPAPRRRRRRSRWSRRRSTGWPPAACTTSSAAASTATRSTTAGSSRTSRRCSTTTPLLASTYLHAWVVTGRERYREVVEETLDYMLRELRFPDGGLRVGAGRRHGRRRGADLHVDAGRGGGRRASAPSCSSRSSTGAHRARRARARAARSACSPRATRGRSRFATTRRSRRGTGSRSRRSRRRGYRLERDDWLDAARELGEFLLGPLSADDGRLLRSIRDGRTSGSGFLDDYANVAHGLIELHVATGELRWLLEARRLALLAVELFADDEHGGFFLSPADGDARVPRTKDLQDTPIPSGNSMLA